MLKPRGEKILHKLSIEDRESVVKTTALRFQPSALESLVMPEVYTIYEQGLIEEDELFKLCCEASDAILSLPKAEYVNPSIVSLFVGSNVVPLRIDYVNKTIYCCALPEITPSIQRQVSDEYKIELIFVTLFHYIKEYKRHWGSPDFMLPVPVTDLFEFVITEGIQKGASDVTIEPTSRGVQVYYTIRKRIVTSKRSISKDDLRDLITHLGMLAGQTTTGVQKNKPRYMSVDLNSMYRGRVTINSTYWGENITIRYLSNEPFKTGLESLNISKSTIEFIDNVYLNDKSGLRILIGETASGKNTTSMASLIRKMELKTEGDITLRKYKVVSVENPVELVVEGITQLVADNEEQFLLQANSLIRQNPDIVYISEMTDATSKACMNVANTGKEVYSTIHANSIPDVISRIADLTGMNPDRIIQNIHSCIIQKLVRDPSGVDRVLPITRVLEFTQELKDECSGKPLGEMAMIVRRYEDDFNAGDTKIFFGM